MARLFDRVLDFVGWESNEDAEDEMYEEESSEGNLSRHVVQAPQNILEARELCDHLKSNKAIIMNVEGVDTPIAQRMVDFLSGAVYCLDGDIQKISAGIFLATPASIEITGDLKDDIKNKGVFSWVK